MRSRHLFLKLCDSHHWHHFSACWYRGIVWRNKKLILRRNQRIYQKAVLIYYENWNKCIKQRDHDPPIFVSHVWIHLNMCWPNLSNHLCCMYMREWVTTQSISSVENLELIYTGLYAALKFVIIEVINR